MVKAFVIEEGLCHVRGTEYFYRKMSRCRIKKKPYYRVYESIDTFIPVDENVFQNQFKIKAVR
jgi:hypothetical protein